MTNHTDGILSLLNYSSSKYLRLFVNDVGKHGRDILVGISWGIL